MLNAALLIALTAAAVLAGLYAWAWDPLRRWVRARGFTVVARRLGAELAPAGEGYSSGGFLPTLVAVYGAHGRLRNVLTWERPVEGRPGERVHFLEYRFSLTGRWAWWRRRESALVVALELGQPLPLMTIKRAGRRTKPGKTEFKAEAERLVVQVVDQVVEVWSTERSSKRARRLVTPELRRLLDHDAKWDVRAAADWLVVLHHAPVRVWRVGEIEGHLRGALALRDALG